MKKLAITIVIIIAAIFGIYMVISGNKKKNDAQTAIVAQSNAAVAVRAALVEQKEVSLTYENNGVFAPKQEVQLSAETPGRVEKVLVKEGAVVRPGQTLAIIKGDKQDVGVANARAVYNNALAEVDRFENAYASGGVTQQQLAQVKLQLENAKNNLNSAQISANDVNVRASFAGVV